MTSSPDLLINTVDQIRSLSPYLKGLVSILYDIKWNILCNSQPAVRRLWEDDLGEERLKIKGGSVSLNTYLLPLCQAQLVWYLAS